MAKMKVQRDQDQTGLWFWLLCFDCPACAREHRIPFDDLPNDLSLEAPNLLCEMTALGPLRDGIVQECKYRIIDGRIQFSDESTHALAGQTVPMEDVG